MAAQYRKKDRFIMDGHYVFGDRIAFTDEEGEMYDRYLYLYIDPDILRKRMEASPKNRKYLCYDPKCQCFVRPNTRDVVLVDAVINTGETIRRIRTPDMKIACCVINEHAVGLFESQIYTVRVSSNSFVGAGVRQQSGHVGPDTTMRLFNQI